MVQNQRVMVQTRPPRPWAVVNKTQPKEEQTREGSPMSAVARSGSEMGLYKINFSIAKGAWYQIHFSVFQLYRNEVRTDSDYRICTCSFLYGLVSKPALPPESPQQIGFSVVGRFGLRVVGYTPDGSRSVPTAPRTLRGARSPTDSRAVGV